MAKNRRKELLDEDQQKDRYDYSTFYVLKRLISYIGKGNYRLVFPLAVFIALNVIFNWFSPLVFQILIDEGLGGAVTGGGSSGSVDIIFQLGSIFFFLTIGGVLARIAQGYIIQKLATLTMYGLRDELFKKFQKLGLDYHEGPGKTAGKKINYLTGDVNTIQELIQSGLLMVFGNVFLLFGAILFMIILSPQLTLVTFAIVPAILGLGALIFVKARATFKELRERVSSVTSNLDESIMGMRIIQAFAVEEDTFEEFEKSTEQERISYFNIAKIMAFVPGIAMMVITLGLAALFFTAGILIREGTVTQGTLVAFIFYIFMFFEPLFSLISFFTLFQNSVAAGNRMVGILNEEPSIKEDINPVELKDVKGEIQFKDVNFSYNDGEGPQILKNIDIKINAKERLALVGYTGAGKSTFIKLLSRFYDPSKGEILLDGENLKRIKVKDLRESEAIVLQDNFLFSETIMENIRYGKLSATDEEVIEVAKKVHAHEMIMKLENGYETNVGERGDRLSEGQKQLVCFARALINDPAILILDEATSSIDPYSELLIQQALEELLKGRTSISIAHRLSTIINSDRIVVLDKGKIIEQGTHKQLVEKDGFYNHLYQMQFKDPFQKEIPEEKEKIKDLDILRESYDDKNRFSRGV